MKQENIFVGRTIAHMGWSFVKAMYYWAKTGFKVVPYYVSWKRRLICKNCSEDMGHRCPTCGCFTLLLSKLASSRCTNWDKFVKMDKAYIVFNNYEPVEN